MRLTWLTGSIIAALGVGAPAHAATVWCALEDANLRQGFVTNLRHEAELHPQQLRKLASRFRRTVNERYGTAFSNDGGVCLGFATQPKAESRLATVQTGLQARGFRITTVGVF